jgi:hypothetical protein
MEVTGSQVDQIRNKQGRKEGRRKEEEGKICAL